MKSQSKWDRRNLQDAIMGVVDLGTFLFAAISTTLDAKEVLSADQRYIVVIALLFFGLSVLVHIVSLRSEVNRKYINKESFTILSTGQFVEIKNDGPEAMERVEVWMSHTDIDGKLNRDKVTEFYSKFGDIIDIEHPQDTSVLRVGESLFAKIPPALGNKPQNTVDVDVVVFGNKSSKKVSISKTLDRVRFLLY